MRASELDWVILRLGGVVTPDPGSDVGPDLVYFEGLLPVDGRIQTVDVRDVAMCLRGATTVDATGECSSSVETNPIGWSRERSAPP